jgi:hypothetical protein
MTGYADLAEVTAFTESIAEALGDGFQVTPWDRGSYYGPHLALVKGDLRIVPYQRTDGDRTKRRLRFKGVTPGPSLTRAMFSDGVEISASMNRPAASIARQITSKLLPPYQARVTLERAQWEAARLKHEAQEADAAELAASLPNGIHHPQEFFGQSSHVKWSTDVALGFINVHASGSYTLEVTVWRLTREQVLEQIPSLRKLVAAPPSSGTSPTPRGVRDDSRDL